MLRNDPEERRPRLDCRGDLISQMVQKVTLFLGGVPLTPPKLGAWGQPGTAHADGSISPPPPAAGAPMISSVAKVVQPTATVSSVPVCGPSK
jgi:hypothetical protein